MTFPGSEDDFFDEGDDDGDILDTLGEPMEDPAPAPEPRPSAPSPSTTSPALAIAPAPDLRGAAPVSARKRVVRVKPLPASLAAKFGDVTSILVTRADGSQLLLVKGNRNSP